MCTELAAGETARRKPEISTGHPTIFPTPPTFIFLQSVSGACPTQAFRRLGLFILEVDVSYKNHALREFSAAGWLKNGKYCDEMQQLICEQVIELLDLFDEHGHSGSSAPYAIELFSKLAKFEPLVPLTGEDFEWNEVGDNVFQNNRCSHVFKSADRFDGQPYDIEAIIFYDWYTDEETGEQRKSYFTSYESAQPIAFPYTPERVYRERVK